MQEEDYIGHCRQMQVLRNKFLQGASARRGTRVRRGGQDSGEKWQRAIR